MKSAVERLNETIEKACKDTKKEKSEENGPNNNENPKGDEEEMGMKIDKSKLTDAERAFMESTEKTDTMHGAFFDIVPFSWDSGISRHSLYRMQQSAEIAAGLGCRAVIFHAGLRPVL